MSDTIFALATAPGRAAVAVVRLSGPETARALTALAGPLPPPRLATLRRLRDSAGDLIDQGLVLWFAGPASYTGEDAAELHLHGGAAVVERCITVLADLGLRLAEPGEFTRRAFEAGKLDLAQAEAVADLIDAETEAQAKQALDQLGRSLSRRYDAWREQLIDALAVLEAAVDFPDEDLPADVAARARPTLTALLEQLDAALADADRGRRVREGYRIAVIGAPNAGKSSLLNALAGRDAAIVTEHAGTTRDVIEVPLVLAGYRVLLADTAGVRSTVDVIEAEGVRRARAWAQSADLRLWVVDASADDGAWREGFDLFQTGDLAILNKADQPIGADGEAARAAAGAALSLSTRSAADVSTLRSRLEERVIAALGGAEFPAATHVRHAKALTEARESLARALNADPDLFEIMAEEVRLATRQLSRVTGRVDHEDVLDRVFASFCIGK